MEFGRNFQALRALHLQIFTILQHFCKFCNSFTSSLLSPLTPHFPPMKWDETKPPSPSFDVSADMLRGKIVSGSEQVCVRACS